MAQQTSNSTYSPNQMDSGLEANLRIVEGEQKRALLEKRSRLTESDFICTGCIKHYEAKNRGLFAPICSMTCQINQREAKAKNAYGGLKREDELFLRSMDNPVAFAKMMFDWEARGYQQELLLCSAQQKVVRAGRRIGKTESMVIYILWLMFTRSDFEIIIICPYERQVELIFESIRKFINKSQEFRNSVTKDRKDPQSIHLKNGSNATGFTAGVKTGEKAAKVRGQGANALFIDECVAPDSQIHISEHGVRPAYTLTMTDQVLGGDADGVYVGSIQALKNRQAELISVGTPINVIQCTPNHPLFDGHRDVYAKDAENVIVSLSHRDLSFGVEAIRARLVGYIYGDGWASNTKTMVNGGYIGFSGQKEDLEQIVEDLVLLGDKRHKIYERESVNAERGIFGKCSMINSTHAYGLLGEHVPKSYKVFQRMHVPAFVKGGKDYVKQAFLSGLFSAESTAIRYQQNGKTPAAIDLSMRSMKSVWVEGFLGDVRDLLGDCGISSSIYPSTRVDVQNFGDDDPRYEATISIHNNKNNIDAFVDKIGFCYSVGKAQSANIWRLYRWYQRTWNSDPWKKNRKIRNMSGLGLWVAENLRIPHSTVKYHRNRYDPLFSCPAKTAHEVLEHFLWKPGYVRLPISHRRSLDAGRVINMTSGAKNRFFASGMLTHNCDYLDTGSVEALMALFVDNPDVLIWASSTPTGKRSDFYRWNTELSLGFKAFHYTSRVSPYWDARTELYFRSIYSSSGFEHEFLAEFGEAAFAVFKSEHLDASIQTYYYQDITGPRTVITPQGPKACLYTFGVDWNSTGTGVHIVVLEYDPCTFKFRVVQKEVVDPKEFTQVKAVRKIIELNDYWNPRHIYVDQGFGEMQIEELHQYGRSSPDTGLLKKVKGIVMASKTEIVDPATNMKVKKYTKELVVEIAARRVEENQCIFPRIEDTKGSLVNQLRNFEVVRYSASGKPVYSQGNEHTATAWMLSIFAMMMEFTSLARAFNVTGTGSVTNLGSHERSIASIPIQQREGSRQPAYQQRSLVRSNLPGKKKLLRKLTLGGVRRNYTIEKRETF